MGRGRVFSREFKLSVVRQVVSGEKRPAQVCREHGLGEGLLLRWRREYETHGEAAFAPHSRPRPKPCSGGSPSWNASAVNWLWRTPS